jgi:hypothetical protein
MMNGMAAFMVAVGGTSLVCYLLMNRVQNRKSGRENAGGGDVSGTSSGGSSGGDGWSLFSRCGSDNSSSDSSTSSCGDSGGGGSDGGGWRWWRLMPKTPLIQRQFDLPQDRLFRFIPVFPRHQFGIV